MDLSKLEFFNNNGYNLNFEIKEKEDGSIDYWSGTIYLPKVSVGLYSNTTIYVLEKTSNDDSEFDNEYSFPTGPGSITFYWDTQNKFVDEFFMFNFDETYALKETSALVYTPNDGPDCNPLIINRFDTYDIPLDDEPISKALPIHIAFRANENHDATTYNRTLVMAYNGDVIARIKFYAETVEEDERLKIWNSNLGYNITPEDTIIFYKSDIKEYMPDYILLNEKRKELMLEGSNIYPYIGSYKAIINAIKFFGYDNLNIIEYWRNVNKDDENFGKIYHSSRYSLKKKETLRIGFRNIVLPNKDYKKINALALVYDINKPTGEIDEWELPLVKEQFAYTIEEALIKLFALRKKLNKEFMPGSSRIIDIIGEGNYFGIQSIFKIGDYSHIDLTPTDWSIDFDVYPKKYAHITDNEYFNRYITIVKNAGIENVELNKQMLSDLLNEPISNYSDENGYLTTPKNTINDLSTAERCEYYLNFYEDAYVNYTAYKDIADNDTYPFENDEYNYYDNDTDRFSAKVVLKCNNFNTVTFEDCDLRFNCLNYNYMDYDDSDPSNGIVNKMMDFNNPNVITNPNPLKYTAYCDEDHTGSYSDMTAKTDMKEYDLYNVTGPDENIGVYIYKKDEEGNLNWQKFTDFSFFNIDDVYKFDSIKWTIRMSEPENQYDDDLKQAGIIKKYESKPLSSDYYDSDSDDANPDGSITFTDNKLVGEVLVQLPYIGYYDVTLEINGQKKTKKKCIKVEPYNIEMIGFYYDIRQLPKNIDYNIAENGEMYNFINNSIKNMYGWAVSERTDFTYPDDQSVPLYDAFGNMTNTGPYYNENVDDEWYLADNLTWEMSKLEPLIKYTRYIRNGVDVKPYTWFLLGYEYSKIAGKVNPHWEIINNETGTRKIFNGRYLTMLLKKEGNYTVNLTIEDKLGNKYNVSRNIIVVKKSANYKLYQTFKKDYDYMTEQNLLKELNSFNSFYENNPDYEIPTS